MKKNKIYTIGLALTIGAGAALSSCVDTDSTLVDFGPQLNSPNDTVYSLMGILNKMQVIADRTIILGELKGELTSVTDAATTDLKEIAGFTADADNSYNAPEDYYAVIQNCNYYIANVDTSLSLRGESVFIREYAAVKAFRAWTYLQLAIHYGKVPFIDKPLMTEEEADPSLYPWYDVEQICDYFIPDLAPYVETDLPLRTETAYQQCFIPVRVLLGDLCLWSGRYLEAAQYYHDYLTHSDNPQPPEYTAMGEWSSYEFLRTNTSISSSDIFRIRMENLEYDGIVSGLDDIFCSTDDNLYYYQATGSTALSELSQSQRYVMVYTNPTTNLQDTITVPDNIEYTDARQRGDLRYSARMSVRYGVGGTNGYASVSQTLETLHPASSSGTSGSAYVAVCNLSSVYLRMAEAYNRAGLPQSAFAVLKYGLSSYTVSRRISADEQARGGDLLTWSQYYFITQDMSSTGTVNTAGIHSYGCGQSYADTLYTIPSLATREDSILYVEDLICDEMALEQSFDGNRFADLQRIALRRNDTDFLARKVAGRNGADNFDQELYTRLSDRNNWYLPLE